MAEPRTPWELPGYAEAELQTAVIRRAAFHPVLERVNGYYVTPMTLPQYSLLRLAGSPFIPPFEPATVDDLAQFLWILCPRFVQGESRMKRRFYRRCRAAFSDPRQPIIKTVGSMIRWNRRRIAAAKRFIDTTSAARRFVTETLQDRIASTVSDPRPDYYCDEAAVVMALCGAGLGTEADILKIPLKRIFQYLKAIVERNTPPGQSPQLFNPSDEVVDRYLETSNQKN